MILYEITRRNKTQAQTLPGNSADPHGTGVFKRFQHRRQQQQQQVELAKVHSIQPEVPAIPAVAMGKHQYNDWLNAHVYPYFPKGTKTTFKVSPYVPGQVPDVWFIVSEIQELYWSVQHDRDTRQPRAVGLVHKDYIGKMRSPVWYPPILLRPLNTEELKTLDSLRNQKSEQRNVADEGTPSDDSGSNSGYAG